MPGGRRTTRSATRFEHSVYDHNPVWMQNIACSVRGGRLHRLRQGGNFSKLLESAMARSAWSDSEVAAFRDRRLERVLVEATSHSSVHADGVALISRQGSGIHGLDRLGSFPIIQRDAVRELVGQNEIQGSGVVAAHTSGASGSPLEIPISLRCLRMQWAVWWRFRTWHGIPLDQRCALFAGTHVVPVQQHRPPFWRHNLPGRQLIFSPVHLGPATVAHYVRRLNRARCEWWHGHPSTLALLADLVSRESLDVAAPRWITTGAETLTGGEAVRIESVFGVQPRTHYGLTEPVANMSQCESGLFHVDEDFAAVEFLDPDPDGFHRLIGTSLWNEALPLIRYDTGDLVAGVGANCSCGRPGRTVERVVGRASEFVALANGVRLGPVNQIFTALGGVRAGQLVVRDGIPERVRLVPIEPCDYRAIASIVRARLVAFSGSEDLRVLPLDFVADLPLVGRGKLRSVVAEE